MTEPICGEHLAAVAELEAACFSEPWSRDALSLLLTEQASGVVLMQNGAVVAYGGVLWAPDEGQIINIAVSACSFTLKYGSCAMKSPPVYSTIRKYEKPAQ